MVVDLVALYSLIPLGKPQEKFKTHPGRDLY